MLKSKQLVISFLVGTLASVEIAIANSKEISSFNPEICQGESVEIADLVKYFTPGERVANLGSGKILRRIRAWDWLTGVGEWEVTEIPLIERSRFHYFSGGSANVIKEKFDLSAFNLILEATPEREIRIHVENEQFVNYGDSVQRTGLSCIVSDSVTCGENFSYAARIDTYTYSEVPRVSTSQLRFRRVILTFESKVTKDCLWLKSHNINEYTGEESESLIYWDFNSSTGNIE